jgi:septal ring factor EnvC (AmiA/AmiB activator)
MQQPPQPPPGEPPPTQATRPLGTPAVPAEREVYLDPEVADRIDRASFWSKFGSAAAVLASILGVIALVIAIDARNQDDSGSSNAGLRDDVSQLQSDVNRLERQTSSADDASQDTRSLESQLSDLEDQLNQISEDQQQASQDISSLQQDLSELNDRVDQVEQAQEDAAAGGP